MEKWFQSNNYYKNKYNKPEQPIYRQGMINNLYGPINDLKEELKELTENLNNKFTFGKPQNNNYINENYYNYESEDKTEQKSDDNILNIINKDNAEIIIQNLKNKKQLKNNKKSCNIPKPVNIINHSNIKHNKSSEYIKESINNTNSQNIIDNCSIKNIFFNNDSLISNETDKTDNSIKVISKNNSRKQIKIINNYNTKQKEIINKDSNNIKETDVIINTDNKSNKNTNNENDELINNNNIINDNIDSNINNK